MTVSTQSGGRTLVYGSVCSGIEAASVAWHPLGWRASFLSEIEAFPRSVLSHHYPDTPLHGDFTTIKAGDYEPIDLLVGGTPCQSFSVAGLRGGLDDDRGNLALEYLRLADRLRPRWLVWENVPGVLSSNGGRDFGAILGGMVELGYGFAYRVLDAQFFGVAQRRRRVFVVGYLGDWRRAAAVLFERHSLSGNPAPRREAGEGVANALTDRPDRGGGNSEGQRLVPQGHCGQVAPSLNAAFGSKLGLDNQHIDSGAGMFVAHTLKGEGFDASEDGTGRGTPIVPVCFSAKDHGADAMHDLSPTLRAGGHSKSHANAGVMPAIAFDTTQITSAANYSNPQPGDPCHPLAAGAHAPAIAGTVRSHTRPGSNEVGSIVATSAVRRLTPRECERLQGFPDDYSLVPHRGRPAADGPRYKALGNSMAVPVMAHIGRRIEAVEAIAATSIRKAA